jgi:hypothetical protein
LSDSRINLTTSLDQDKAVTVPLNKRISALFKRNALQVGMSVVYALASGFSLGKLDAFLAAYAAQCDSQTLVDGLMFSYFSILRIVFIPLIAIKLIIDPFHAQEKVDDNGSATENSATAPHDKVIDQDAAVFRLLSVLVFPLVALMVLSLLALTALLFLGHILWTLPFTIVVLVFVAFGSIWRFVVVKLRTRSSPSLAAALPRRPAQYQALKGGLKHIGLILALVFAGWLSELGNSQIAEHNKTSHSCQFTADVKTPATKK